MNEKHAILKARAAELARPPEPQEAASEHLQVIEFQLASERYAVETVHVREVYALRELTPLPCTPPFVPGIINVRGQILAVIDLKQFFALPRQGLSDLNKVIIVHTADMDVGLLADAVSGARSVSLRDIQPALPVQAGGHADYIKGITRESVSILDVPRMLADPRIIVDEDVPG